ncbi:hypothetical protein DACRYDRAFT_116689 [Dacryopinax primogenitus]|uniref:Uncharacterized protein n=1 Tax=Dacryopinax primogenitus (strain DJM 731) TaxID=1858805 RepID=M5FYI2_DACPD|nr:uncharacterized protein DACRYDRAFT_116689 [Dacryopinax primogenitus]EJU01579.1 hypothetical protein DACRYDRAFT_116689 [Dacryopinax primogenitus]
MHVVINWQVANAPLTLFYMHPVSSVPTPTSTTGRLVFSRKPRRPLHMLALTDDAAANCTNGFRASTVSPTTTAAHSVTLSTPCLPLPPSSPQVVPTYRQEAISDELTLGILTVLNRLLSEVPAPIQIDIIDVTGLTSPLLLAVTQSFRSLPSTSYSIRITGAHFVNSYNILLKVLGVNLSGTSKTPRDYDFTSLLQWKRWKQLMLEDMVTMHWAYVHSHPSKLPPYWLPAFVSMHQDVFSRCSGDSKAPARTFTRQGQVERAVGGDHTSRET